MWSALHDAELILRKALNQFPKQARGHDDAERMVRILTRESHRSKAGFQEDMVWNDEPQQLEEDLRKLERKKEELESQRGGEHKDESDSEVWGNG